MVDLSIISPTETKWVLKITKFPILIPEVVSDGNL
jgi:hypothetical protein